MKKFPLPLPPGVQQFVLLTRHFFNRLFLNDLVAFEEQMKERVIAVLAFLAIFSAHLSNVALFKYSLLPDKGGSWVEKTYIFTFFMVIMGLVSVLQWEVIFPDTRDYLNLKPLPVRTGLVFAAKFTSLVLFVSFFALGMNALSTFVFAYYLPGWQSTSLLYLLKFLIVHLFCGLAACFSIFFLSIFLLGMTMVILGPRIFRLFSSLLRGVLMIGLAFLLFFFLLQSMEGGLPKLFTHLPELRATQTSSLFYFPPLWFVGLYETWLGTTDPFFLKLRWLALLALFLPSLAFFLTMGLGYQRQLKKPGKSKRTKPILHQPRRALSRILHKLLLCHPLQRAVFYFYQAGLKRSPPHRLRLISYLAVAIALALVVMGLGGGRAGDRPLSDTLLFSLTFILCFFTLVAVRTTVTLPIAHEANWVWRLTEQEKKHHYFSGLRKGLFFFPLLPLFVLLLLFYGYFWDWSKAGLHCLFGLATAWLLAEGLFLRFQKIPFTCSFMPGKARIQYFWLVYLAAFLVFVNSFSWLEGILFRYPEGFYIYFGVAAGLIAGVRLYQHLLFYRRTPLIYEEKLEMVMITLEAE